MDRARRGLAMAARGLQASAHGRRLDMVAGMVAIPAEVILPRRRRMGAVAVDLPTAATVHRVLESLTGN